jgi:signal transduction histidine kinase
MECTPSRERFPYIFRLSHWAKAIGFWRVALVGNVFLGGLIVSAVIFGILEKQEKQLIKIKFGDLADNRMQTIEDSLTQRLTALDWVSAFYASSREVEPSEFRTFTRLALAKYTDLEMLGWAPRVTAAERQAHESAMRREGHAGYQIRQRIPPGSPAPAGKSEAYFPLAYVQPSEEYDNLIGYDVGRQPGVLAAIERTWKSKQQTLVMDVFPDARGHFSLKLCLLEYARTTMPVAGSASSPGESEGVILGVVDLRLMVENALKDFYARGVGIYLFEETALGQTRLIMGRPSSLRNLTMPELQSLPKEPAGICFTGSIAAADRTWKAYCAPTDVFLKEQETAAPWMALTVGILATVVITAYLLLLLGWNRQAEALVQKRTAELLKEQQLLRHLLDLQERDRKLTAFEIHDGLAQLITGVLMKLQALDACKELLPSSIAGPLQEAMQLIQESNQEARRLIGGLQPPMLDELGIVAALEYLIEELRRRHPAVVEFHSQLSRPRLEPPLESALFRIAQESLNNAIRHSQSPRILVELHSIDGSVRLCVRDWGAGFDPQNVGNEHFGLRGIRERARLLGGTATIQSVRGQGTTVTVELPLEGQFGAEDSVC